MHDFGRGVPDPVLERPGEVRLIVIAGFKNGVEDGQAISDDRNAGGEKFVDG